MNIRPAIMIIACILLCGCGNESANEKKIVLTTGFEEGELFFVGDKKCFVPEVNVYIRNLEDIYSEVYGEGLMEQTVDGIPVTDKLSSMSLSRLAEIKALGMLAEERDIFLSDKDLDKCSQAADRYMKSLSDADLKDLEITPELLLSMYEDYALACKVYDDVTKDVNPEISDDEARIITIQRILIKSEDQDAAMGTADAIYARISEGESFDSIADEYNEGEESKYSFGKDTDDFPPEFVDACFNLSKDEVSSPISSEEGLSIIKCISSYDRERTDANKARLVEKRKAEAFDSVYSPFAKKLNTNFNTGLWEDQDISDRKLDSTENFFNVYNEIFGSPGGSRP